MHSKNGNGRNPLSTASPLTPLHSTEKVVSISLLLAIDFHFPCATTKAHSKEQSHSLWWKIVSNMVMMVVCGGGVGEDLFFFVNWAFCHQPKQETLCWVMGNYDLIWVWFSCYSQSAGLWENINNHHTFDATVKEALRALLYLIISKFWQILNKKIRYFILWAGTSRFYLLF